jgi:hypothetical protein
MSPFQSRGLRCPEGGSDRPPEGCAWREGGLGDQSVSVAHALVVRTESPTAAALHLRIAANACAGPVTPHTIEIVPRPAAPDESRGTLAGRRRQTSFAWSAGRPRMTHGTRLDCPSLACNASTRVSRSRRVLVVTHRGGCLRVAILALDDVSPRSVSAVPARAVCVAVASVTEPACSPGRAELFLLKGVLARRVVSLGLGPLAPKEADLDLAHESCAELGVTDA